jgi:hypothetical protein
LPTARAPKLDTALQAAKKARRAFVVLDGTLIPIDRLAADRPFYSGKHRKHGTNLQVIASPDGEILWVSGAVPGSVRDLTAARILGIVRRLAAAGLIVLADKGDTGAGDPVITPYRGRNKPPSQRPPTAPTPAARPRRASQRPAQDPAHPAQAALLPLALRATRQAIAASTATENGSTRNLEAPIAATMPSQGLSLDAAPAGSHPTIPGAHSR